MRRTSGDEGVCGKVILCVQELWKREQENKELAQWAEDNIDMLVSPAVKCIE